MKDRVNEKLIQLNKNVFHSMGRHLTTLLSLFVVLGVFWCLKLTGITLAGEAFCGMEEHVHGEACHTERLICDQNEILGHTHDEGCISKQLICESDEILSHIHDEKCQKYELICVEEEYEGHVHGEDCYTQSVICGSEEDAEHIHGAECYGNSLTCTVEESAGHAHGEECYVLQEGQFICGVEETEGHSHVEECYTVEYICGKNLEEGHVHGEACYESIDECGLEEHVHVESCYSDISADLETEEDWENSVSGVNEETITAEKVVSVARSQLGYTESTLNFEVDLEGVRRGITRYGQWYGNPYGDWSAMFVSFCLHYAGAEDLPANAGPESMRLEWEAEGLYEAADAFVPEVGNIVFLKSDSVEDTEVTTASDVAIIIEVTEDTIKIIQGDFNDTVSERTLNINNSTILGYGLVPESSPYAVMMMSPRAVESRAVTLLGKKINYSTNMFTSGGSFVIYAEGKDGAYYALVSEAVNNNSGSTVQGVPIVIDSDGNIYADVQNKDNLLWNFTSNGNNNNYYIQNVATKRYLHPGGDNYIIFDRNWPTALTASGNGAKFVHTSQQKGIVFNVNQERFEVGSKNNATRLYFGTTERSTVWLDGTNGGLSSFAGSPNQSYSVDVMSEMILPPEWASPTKYNYELRGWYDVTHNEYYEPGETVTIKESTVFYADWMADTYDVGQYNAQVANTVTTDSFITTHLFDYTYLFNVLSAKTTGNSVSGTSHSETWGIIKNDKVGYEGRDSLNFIFLDYGNGGSLDYPNNRDNGVNQYPGANIVTDGIYNNDIGNALFATNDHVPGKVYLGTGDHLFQIMDDPGNPYYGYYYYDSALNAASYNQSEKRFYVYDYLEATSAELNATKSDFLPLNSPYANTNGKQVDTYNYGNNSQYAGMTKYVYAAKNTDSGYDVSTNYAFGMKMNIKFYIPNKPGAEAGNKDLYGNDMCFRFSGDDDLWVLVDGKLALDIGGIHQAEEGEINFSTGEVTVQGQRDNDLSSVVSALNAGEHTLTVMYLERGASHSNCAIYFNLAPRYSLSIQKEDVLTQAVLDGAQFSVYSDVSCTEEYAVELWESEEAYLNLNGTGGTNTFTVVNGSANMWGLGAGNTYYIKETAPPTAAGYDIPKGIIRMILDKQGAASYNVVVLEEDGEISSGFTVHGFNVDEERRQVFIEVTNATTWSNEVTSVEAQKFWNDGKDHTGEAVTVYLTVQDQAGNVQRLQEAQLSDKNGWNHLWENLPKFYQDGTPIIYGLEEAYVAGYYSNVEKLGENVDKYNYTETKWTATDSLENGKTYLLKTDAGCLSTIDVNSDGFKWVDEQVAKQSNLAQWKVTGNGSYKFTNGAEQLINYYNWGSTRYFNANRNSSTTFTKQSYNTANKQIKLYSSSYYIGSLNSNKRLNASDASGGLVFTPMTLSQVNVTKDVRGETAYLITNTPLSEETSLTVYKLWDIENGGDVSLYEREQVRVKLFANGKDAGRTVTLSLKNSWTDKFDRLPYKDDKGTVIEYTVKEDWEKSNWSTEYGEIQTLSGSPPTYSTVVTNTYHLGGPMLPSTGTAARMIYELGGASLMLFSLIYGFVSRRKRERRMK